MLWCWAVVVLVLWEGMVGGCDGGDGMVVRIAGSENRSSDNSK